MRQAAFAFLLLVLSGAALAAEPRTITLAVDHMTCAACPITVRKALAHVAGFTRSAVDMTAHTATVTFDPVLTTPGALVTAVTNAGYPAKVLSNGG
jgi:mercuric ion binding protein